MAKDTGYVILQVNRNTIKGLALRMLEEGHCETCMNNASQLLAALDCGHEVALSTFDPNELQEAIEVDKESLGLKSTGKTRPI